MCVFDIPHNGLRMVNVLGADAVTILFENFDICVERSSQNMLFWNFDKRNRCLRILMSLKLM